MRQRMEAVPHRQRQRHRQPLHLAPARSAPLIRRRKPVMSARSLWLSLLIGVGTAASQTHSIHAPQLGLVFDEAAGALRPIWGIAGSSTLGDPLPLGVTLKGAVVSPSQDYALAL